MQWCSKCNKEYDKSFINCPKCGNALEERAEINKKEKEVFFVSVKDDMEANIVEAKLKAFGVPVLRKYRGIGGLLTSIMGITAFGIDLYVPAEALEFAEEVMKEQPFEVLEKEFEATEEAGGIEEKEKRER